MGRNIGNPDFQLPLNLRRSRNTGPLFLQENNCPRMSKGWPLYTRLVTSQFPPLLLYSVQFYSFLSPICPLNLPKVAPSALLSQNLLSKFPKYIIVLVWLQTLLIHPIILPLCHILSHSLSCKSGNPCLSFLFHLHFPEFI